MNELHILNGDALIDRMVEAGFTHFIVMRECLIDGPVNADSLPELYKARAGFLSPANEDDYYNRVVKELDRLEMVDKNMAVVLWFEDDLFCQSNMWFVLHYLKKLGLTKAIYRVFPRLLENDYRWNGFGRHPTNELKEAYRQRVPFTSSDIELGEQLWAAYVTGNFDQLQKLSLTPSQVFRLLPEVVQAHIDRFPENGRPGRPEKVLQQILDRGITNFNELFREYFTSDGGIYGFGDLQVKGILEKMNGERSKG